MSNQLFTEVSSEQQEIVAGGISFAITQTGFQGKQVLLLSNSSSNPTTGSTSTGGSQTVVIETLGSNVTGADLPDDFDFSFFFGA
ncbi:MAG TPA: CTB family bacteriocin [Nodularia sp. (in: cyanobacteria)]|nr:CTB family bacteriocin [Nodularia sp. (in: cyanobacteria)]